MIFWHFCWHKWMVSVMQNIFGIAIHNIWRYMSGSMVLFIKKWQICCITDCSVTTASLNTCPTSTDDWHICEMGSGTTLLYLFQELIQHINYTAIWSRIRNRVIFIYFRLYSLHIQHNMLMYAHQKLKDIVLAFEIFLPTHLKAEWKEEISALENDQFRTSTETKSPQACQTLCKRRKRVSVRNF